MKLKPNNFHQYNMDFHMFEIFIAVLLISSTNSMNSSMIHTFMNQDELEEIFGSTDVPKYELVRIHYSNGREEIGKTVHFNAFNETVSLKLSAMNTKLFSRKTPIWFADGEINSYKVRYTPINVNALNDALKLYEDPENKAGIAIEKGTDGKIVFTANIRNHWILKPIHERLYEKWTELFEESEPPRFPRSSRTSLFVDYHIVFQSTSSDNDEFSRLKRSADIPMRMAEIPYRGPDPIYLRTLVYVNYGIPFISDQELRLYKQLIYLVCFWNAVNMKYSEFGNPKIKLHIAGIVIGINRWANPYLQIPNSPDSKCAIADDALVQFSQFVAFRDPAPGLWDIVVSQSNFPLCRDENSQKHVEGIAYVSQTCNNSPSYYLKTVAIIKDNYNFEGVLAATHEIGHLLGAHHDGRYKCRDEGFIMSSTRNRSFPFNDNSWSSCSRLEILKKLRKNQKTCWNNIPMINKNDTVPEMLPGHIVSLNEQCQVRDFYEAFDKIETNCKSLSCCERVFRTSILRKCDETGPPFPGSNCGEKMHCKFQKCVPLEE